MMEKSKLILISTFAFLGLSFMPVKVKELKFPDNFSVGKEKLIVSGTGVRQKYFIDLYYAVLYMKHKEKNPQKIIDANEEMSFKIHIVSRHVNNQNLEEALREGFKLSMGGNSSGLQKEIDLLVNAFSDKIQVGDEFDLSYMPDNGVNVKKNGKDRVLIQGLTFKKALFGIWFGKEPADEDLKQELLGLND